MRKIRKAAMAASAVALIGGTVVVATAPSASATDRGSRCGSAYHFKKSWPIHNVWGSDTEGRTVGYIDVYWSNSTGKNCAIARPKNGIYKPNHIKVRVVKSGSGNWDQDGYGNENYKKFAGPVYAKARGACVNLEAGFEYNNSWDRAEAWGSYEKKHCS
ncbi:hypothetical protein ACFY1A_38895 [Streptomyces sp. NPDC001520]|uniref:hypothetical protein n=1 Tax=Streptomyces sp. NPDC001520 TaxID=3364581 RepID=UPI0036A9C2D3